MSSDFTAFCSAALASATHTALSLSATPPTPPAAASVAAFAAAAYASAAFASAAFASATFAFNSMIEVGDGSAPGAQSGSAA